MAHAQGRRDRIRAGVVQAETVSPDEGGGRLGWQLSAQSSRPSEDNWLLGLELWTREPGVGVRLGVVQGGGAGYGLLGRECGE